MRQLIIRSARAASFAALLRSTTILARLAVGAYLVLFLTAIALAQPVLVQPATDVTNGGASVNATFSSTTTEGNTQVTLAAANTIATVNLEQKQNHEVVFVDTGVQNWQPLVKDLQGQAGGYRQLEVYLLNSYDNGIQKMRDILVGYRNLEAIHIISHGANGEIKLGRTWLSGNNLSASENGVREWSAALRPNADILLYGCTVAKNQAGQHFVDDLAKLTGLDVAASTNNTGSALLGGDWDLEYHHGTIESTVALRTTAQQNWVGLMAVGVGSVSTGKIAANSSSVNIPHTASGTDRLMLVGIAISKDGTETISSVKYNGTDLDPVGVRNGSNGAEDVRIEIWSLVAPVDTGPHNVTVTIDNPGHDGVTVGVMTFTGVNQSTPLGTFAAENGNDSSGSVVVSSATGELVFGAVGLSTGSNRTFTQGTGQTGYWDLFEGKGNGSGSTEAGAATVETSYSWGATEVWAIGSVSIKPASTSTTTLGSGTDPGNASLAPGGAPTMADAFTFQTSTGSDTITGVTVTLASGTSAGLSLIEITNDAGSTVYGSSSNPGSDTPTIALSTNITATTSPTQYKIRVTPKTHANMPAPAGSSYAVTARISAWSSTNSQAGSDSAGTTVTIDNASPGNVTAATATAGDTQVALAWTNPGDADLSSIIVLRRAGSTVTDTPVEGTTYTVGNTIGSSTVVLVITAPTASGTDTGLTNGTAYHYKIFTRDTNGNYSATGVVPTGSPATPDIPDVTPPADITDLSTGAVTSSSIALSWTAPGDDGSSGTATSYDIRYSTSAITAGNWAAATQVTGEPGPSVAGTAESFTVTGLSSSTTYYFALKTADEVPNESGVSNSPNATTSATPPPAVGVRIAQSSDDAEELNPPAGTMDLTSSDLELPYEAGTEQTIGMRFQNISVPAGATITSAYIQFTTDELDAGATSLTFHGEDADNPVTFTSTAGNISSRTKTTASVDWNSIPEWDLVHEAGLDQRTPDLSAIIQEIVDRGGWSSGNAIVIIATGTGERTAESYDGEPTMAPLLNIEYTVDSTPPGDVIDLSTGTVTNSSIVLNWTAPGDDGATGTATAYDIRYSTSAITAGNWAAATTVSGEPTPSVAGTAESFTVTGLSASTTYYFALKTVDEIPNSSGVSNSPNATTLVDPTLTQTGYSWSEDTATFTSEGNDTLLDFATGTTYILGLQVALSSTLGSGTWNLQVREDGAGSWLNVYDLSGGNSPVWQTYATHTFAKTNGDEVLTSEFGNTNAPGGFTAVNGEFSDDNNGLSDGYTGTNIYTELQFALRAEATATGHTYEFRVNYGGADLDAYDLYAQAGDFVAPADITDLSTGTVTNSSVVLTWTAPGDDASTGTATSYDIRYSTSAITAGNWAAATPVTGEPSPSVAGTAESFTVTGFSSSTTYYFALKTADEVPNESGVSNSPNATTSATPPPAVGVRIAQSSDDAEELNPPAGTMDLTSSDLELPYEAGTEQTIGMRFQNISVPAGATITSAYIQFTTDELDAGATSLTFHGEDADNPVTFTSTAGNISSRTKTTASVDWNSIPEWDLVHEAGLDQRTPDLSAIIQEIVDRGGWSSGNAIVIIATGTGERTAESYDGEPTMAPLLNIEYTVDSTPPGDVIDLSTGTVTNSSIVLNWTAPGDDGATGTATAYDIRYSTSAITAGNWAAATTVSGEPTPSVAGTAESFTVTGLSASTTYYFALKTVDEIPNSSGVSNSPNATTLVDPTLTQTGYSWSEDTATFTSEGNDTLLDFATGTTYILGLQVALSSTLGSGTWNLQVREDGAGSWLNVYDLSGGNSPVWQTYATHTFAKTNGDEVLTSEFGNTNAPGGFTAVNGEFSDDNNGLSDGYTGTNIYTELQFALRAEATATGHTYEFRVNYGGADLDAYDLYAQAGDFVAPADITDLSTGTVTNSSVVLTWTAPGDDASTGTATSYDIRYSTSAITAGNWAAATPVTGEPSPSVAGTAESFTVTGFSSSTTYYFALKTADEVPNESGVSNSPNATTSATPPPAVGVRIAQSSDDAEELNPPAGTMDLTSSDLELPYEAGTEQTIGMRFQNISVPAGATITSAYIQFTTDELDAGATSLTFHGEDADNPVTFTSTAGNISSRTKTTASVDWNSIPEWDLVHEAGLDQRTPDLSAIIQEIVDRGGWSSGNAIVIIATGTGERTAESYDGEPTMAPLLNIEYTVDSTPPGDVIDLSTGTVTNSTVALTWTAPGDDGSTGTATAYDIRYSTSAITAGNWASATTVSGEPTPSVAGTAESFTVTGLSASTTYYFALKTVDEIPNSSGVSNSPNATTLVDPTLTQTGYVWSDDTATFTSKGDDTALSFATGTTYLLGLQVTLTNSLGSGAWTLQVREDGAGSWLNVYDLSSGNSPVWQTYDTHTFAKANGNEVLTGEFGHTTAPSGFTAVNGEFSDDNNGLTDGYTGTNIYTELQYAIRAEAAADGHTYEFRVNFEGADLDGYNIYAQANPLPSISGTVFEDVNYGGGAGRTMAASSGVARSGARVELFDAAGDFVTFTTTDGSGDYSFTSLATGNYTVRVVNNTVTSSRTGYTTAALAVQTYRTTATSGTAVAVTDHVGGETPNLADAGNGSTTLAALTTGSTTAQSITSVTLGGSDITGLDFGFNFDTIVNVNDAGQGSLRQFMTNANALDDDASLAQSGLVAAKENAVFMISNGTAAAGLRATNDYFSAGVATIDVASGFTISTPMVINAQTQPGWTSSPIVELNGGGAGVVGLTVTAGSSIIRGFAINRFGSHGISLSVNGGNTVAGCFIGTNAAGSATEPNSGYGILVSATPSNIIGGSSASDRNIISGNSYGIYIDGAAATGNTVLGNTIGLAADGTSPLGNSAYGIRLSGGAHTNTIGGTSAGSRNVISANTLSGIGILSASTANNVILGNYIGTDANGSAPLGNSIGVYVSGANNTIGGTITEARNVISGNVAYGIYVYGSAATGTLIQGNHIGADADGTADLGNANHGIYIAALASGNTVGGTAEGAGNLIRFNSGRGVVVAGTSTGNAIHRNSIYGNTSLGIDLVENGVTTNNGTTNASLPNYEMDHPVFIGAALDGDTLHVSGYVGSAPDQATFAGALVEVFESDDDASGFGQGKTYLGALTTDANGNFIASLDVTGKGLTIGESLTGTATDGSNNTSEFGANATLTGLPTLSVTKLSYVISDPSNNTTNPKRIPGAVVEYHLIAQNSGDGAADADTIVLSDTIDTATLTYNATSGVTFTDGATSSSLSLGPVTYSQTAAPGPYVYDYTPVPDGNGYDDKVTALRVGTTGNFDFGGSPAPSFTLKFRVKVK